MNNDRESRKKIDDTMGSYDELLCQLTAII